MRDSEESVIAPAAAVAKATAAELALLRVVGQAGQQSAAASSVERLAAGVGAKALCTAATKSGVAAAVREEAQRVPATLVALCSHGRSGNKADDIRQLHGIEPGWEVLHGDPKEVIRRSCEAWATRCSP